MPAKRLNLKGDYRIEKGASFRMVITVTEDDAVYDLTAASVAAQIRETKDAETIIASFTAAIDTTLGTITLTMSGTVTGAITQDEGVWDCLLTESDGFITRLLEGNVSMDDRVTR